MGQPTRNDRKWSQWYPVNFHDKAMHGHAIFPPPWKPSLSTGARRRCLVLWVAPSLYFLAARTEAESKLRSVRMQTHLSKGAQNLQHRHCLHVINDVFHHFYIYSILFCWRVWVVRTGAESAADRWQWYHWYHETHETFRNISAHSVSSCLHGIWADPACSRRGWWPALVVHMEAGTRSVSHTAKHKMCNNCHLHPLALIIQLFLTLSGQRSFSPNGSLQAYVMRRSHLVKYWFQTMADLQALALCCGGPEPSTPTSSACQNTVNAMQYKSHWMWDKQSLK